MYNNAPLAAFPLAAGLTSPMFVAGAGVEEVEEREVEGAGAGEGVREVERGRGAFELERPGVVGAAATGVGAGVADLATSSFFFSSFNNQ